MKFSDDKHKKGTGDLARILWLMLGKTGTAEDKKLRSAIEERYPELAKENMRIAEGLTSLVDFWERNGNKTVNGVPFDRVKRFIESIPSISEDESAALASEIESCQDEERKKLLTSISEKLSRIYEY